MCFGNNLKTDRVYLTAITLACLLLRNTRRFGLVLYWKLAMPGFLNIHYDLTLASQNSAATVSPIRTATCTCKVSPAVLHITARRGFWNKCHFAAPSRFRKFGFHKFGLTLNEAYAY